MRFTTGQYEAAIQALEKAKKQLVPDGQSCSVCGDCGHMAWECGFNPLLAMEMCLLISKSSEQLHEYLHFLAGYESRFGVQIGPSAIVMQDQVEP